MRKIKKLTAAEAAKIETIRTKVRGLEIRVAQLHARQRRAYMDVVASTEFHKQHMLMNENNISHVILIREGYLCYEVCRCGNCLARLQALGLLELVAEESCVVEDGDACSADNGDSDAESDEADGDDVTVSDEDVSAPMRYATQFPPQHWEQMAAELAGMRERGELSDNDLKRVMAQPDIGIC